MTNLWSDDCRRIQKLVVCIKKLSHNWIGGIEENHEKSLKIVAQYTKIKTWYLSNSEEDYILEEN
jgi:hypothetical protein